MNRRDFIKTIGIGAAAGFGSVTGDILAGNDKGIAISLAEMVDMDYLSLDEAKEVAYCWLFSNANEYYRLNLK